MGGLCRQRVRIYSWCTRPAQHARGRSGIYRRYASRVVKNISVMVTHAKPERRECLSGRTGLDGDALRRKQAGVPYEVVFKTRAAIAPGLLERALVQDVPRGFVLGDAGNGSDTAFREAVMALSLPGRGVDHKRLGARRSAFGASQALERQRPSSLAAPAARRRAQAHLRQGVGARPARAGLAGRRMARRLERRPQRAFRARARPCHASRQSALHPEEWLIVEWPETEAEPTKYWLSTLPPDIPFDRLLDDVKLRWRIERDCQKLKQEVGLDHYEGRGWRGFHHYATLCIAAYGFLIADRQSIPPSGHPRPERLKASPVSHRPGPTRIRPCAPSGTSQTRSQRYDDDWPSPSRANSPEVPAASEPKLSNTYDALRLASAKRPKIDRDGSNPRSRASAGTPPLSCEGAFIDPSPSRAILTIWTRSASR